MKKSLFLILLISPFFSNQIFPQISGYNLSEFQYGNIPGFEPRDRNALYNQTNILYRQQNLKIRIRTEQFISSDSIKKDYINLSKFSLSYKIDKFDFNVGNINETLGRGLLLRSYEVTGSVYEDQVYRVKQAFYRDLLGFSGQYKRKNFMVKMLHGKVLNNLIPPGFDDRRSDFVSAVESNVRIFKQTLGGRIMRIDAPINQSFYSSVSLEGVLPFETFYYAEYAYGFDKGSGIYTSVSKSFQNIGFSIEYKDYKDLFIGSGITDPPTLVKEHSYKLLNRSTHVTDLFNEKGYQLELFLTFPNNSVLTLNNARAINEYLETFVFYEYFMEYNFYVGKNGSIKTFFDWSANGLESEKSRLASGIYTSTRVSKSISTTIDLQYQYIKRELENVFSHEANNIYSSVTLSKSNKVSLSLLYEFTDDPWIADRINTTKIEKNRHYPAITIGYRPSHKLNISLFGGSRRGGPACTAGICYEVLDFEGIELRITGKF